MEEKEEEREEEQLLWRGVGSGKRKERRKGEGNQEEEDDPWAELEKKRKESKQKNLQDVVQAPPQLKGVKGRLKEYGSGGGVGVDVRDVPGRVGSLRKREEVGALRRSVIDGYRKMMGSKTVKL